MGNGPQEAAADDMRVAAQTLALLRGSFVLGYVMDQVRADVGGGFDIEVTVDVPKSIKKKTSITITCTPNNAQGKKDCKDVRKSLTDQGCKCKNVKGGGVSCVCTV
jgi:hypothetical protein